MNNIDRIKNSRVLLLGSSGFIGQHILQELVKKSAQIILPVRNIHSLPVQISKLNNLDSISLINFDDFLNNSIDLNCDFVINALGYGVNPAKRNFSEMFYINSYLPILLMNKIQKHSCCMVHLGSGAEYLKNQNHHPFLESDKKTDSGLYALSKKFASEYLKEIAPRVTPSIVSIRLFNIYGPGEKDHRLFPSIFNQLSKNIEVNLSDGNQLCDFLYVEDTVNAILHVASECKNNNISDEINVCSGDGVSVQDFAIKVAQKMNKNINLLKFGKIPRRDTDKQVFIGNADKLKKIYGWKQKYDINSGINKYIEQLKK